jgi:hypothetical protein
LPTTSSGQQRNIAADFRGWAQIKKAAANLTKTRESRQAQDLTPSSLN